MKLLLILATVCLSFISQVANAVEYTCKVERKINNERQYTNEQLAKGQFSALLEEKSSEAFLSRCSFAQSEGRVTCDRYKVDKIAHDERIKAKKFYVFHSQFDFQLFSDLSFVENNGRGGVSYGKCVLTSP